MTIRFAVVRVVVLGLLLSGTLSSLAALVGEGPRLHPDSRISQDQIINGELSLDEIRHAGLLVFTTPFNKADGYGDGPHDANVLDQRSPLAGNRPSLQGNGSFLRVNGLDSQTCLECHAIVSNRTVPATLGIGGVGGINTNAIFQPDLIDVADEDFDGIAEFSGRLINPPFLFGSGGVQLLGQEMTQDLQALRQLAIDSPGEVIPLESKGVSFGHIFADVDGVLDVSGVKGVSTDLVVRPFGRKGGFATVREFDADAMAFHLGMQANEVFGGEFADEDKDGVVNEITMGDLSALSIFLTTLETPVEKNTKKHRKGKQLFQDIGCAGCHTPTLSTHSTRLQYSVIDTSDTPSSDSFYSVDLSASPMRFSKNQQGGIDIPLFSDLKRHDMGAALSESLSFASPEQNRHYITPRLWGIADTAPYMHDGRAFTMVDAINMHNEPDSEAQSAAQNFDELNDTQKNQVLSFLLSLQTPHEPAKDLLSGKKSGNK
jgi:hypothetical protein